jgi:hypothetical protein
MTYSSLLRPSSGGNAETYLDGEFDGLLHFYDDGALFTWQHRDGATGYIRFYERKSGMLDRDFVRRVCQSLRKLEPGEAAKAAAEN